MIPHNEPTLGYEEEQVDELDLIISTIKKL